MTKEPEKERESIKQDFMRDGSRPRIEGQFVVCLTNGINFMAETVWFMSTDTRKHFRFCIRAGGEKRIEPERIERIIRINAA